MRALMSGEKWARSFSREGASCQLDEITMRTDGHSRNSVRVARCSCNPEQRGGLGAGWDPVGPARSSSRSSCQGYFFFRVEAGFFAGAAFLAVEAFLISPAALAASSAVAKPMTAV